MERLNKFFRLPNYDRWLFLEAAFWLGIARLSLLILPFRWIAPYLGRHMAESPEGMEKNWEDFVVRVSWAVQKASRHLPWECRCLVQAMAGKGMFKLRGIPSTLYLGMAKDGEDKFKAHAWLRSGDVLITGEQDMNLFTVVSTFAEKEQ